MTAPRACEETRRLLPAHLDGGLPPEQASAVASHLASCAACRAELAFLEATVAALRRLPELPAPAGILEGVRAGISPRPWHRRIGDTARGLLLGVPLGAAATLLVVIGVALFRGKYPGIERQGTGGLGPAPAVEYQPPPEAKRKAVPEPSAPVVAVPEAREPAAPAPVATTDVPPPAAPVRADAAPAAEEAEKDASRAASPRLEFAGEGATAVEEPRERAVVAARKVRAARDEEALPPPVAEAPRPAPSRPSTGDLAATAAGARPAGEAREAEAGPSAGAPGPLAVAERAPVGAAEGEGEREPLEILYVWAGDGEDLADLRGILGREGGRLLEVRAIDPRTGREALLPLQEQMIPTAESVRGGWEIDARLPQRNFSRFLDAVGRRPGYQLLQRQPARPARERSEDQRVKIRLLR